MTEGGLVKLLSYVLFLAAFLPLIFGGTIYKMLLRIFTFKLIVVLVYLTFFAVVTVSGGNAWEIVRGFFRFGMVPQRADSIIAGRHFSLMKRDGAATYALKGTVHGNLSEPDEVRLEILGLTVTNASESKTHKAKVLPEQFLQVELALEARVRELIKPDAFYV